MNCFRIIYITFFVLCVELAVANTPLVSQFQKLSDYFTTDDEKLHLSEAITNHLATFSVSDLSRIDSLGIPQLVHQLSPDSLLHVFTWQYRLSDANFYYGGLVVHRDNIYPLGGEAVVCEEYHEYSIEHWRGGVCYDIVQPDRANKSFYTLLIWDGNNSITAKKSIDILTFDRKGTPIFGLPVFEEDKDIKHRVVFEYNAKQTLLLDYDVKKNAIITNAQVVGDLRYSSVAASKSIGEEFNIYQYENGKWVLYRDVDLRMDTEAEAALNDKVVSPSTGL